MKITVSTFIASGQTKMGADESKTNVCVKIAVSTFIASG